MPLTIHIDPHGQPFTDFYKLRDSLQGAPFTPKLLRRIPYQQLVLCATAPAGGNTTVTLDDVRQEKVFRRSRFLPMDATEFQECRRYLQMEGMLVDLATERALSTVGSWEELSLRQKVWAKLDCLFNHLDNPMPRFVDLDTLLTLAGRSRDIPPEVAQDMRRRVLDIAKRKLLTDKLRNLIGGLAAEVWEYLTDTEQTTCRPKLMRDYQCSADCFRVFTGVQHG